MNKPKENEILIEIEWDSYNTSLLTQKLYRLVERKRADVEIEAKRGSLITWLLIKGIEIEATLLFEELIKYLASRRKKNKMNYLELSPARISLNKQHKSV